MLCKQKMNTFRNISAFIFLHLIMTVFCHAQNYVGTMEGVMSVSPSGGATYTIPIKTPDSHNNFDSQLSLTYNSQAGNGIAGVGWSISGLSSISAVNHTKYYDTDTVSGVEANRSDVYALDGQRLFLLSGTNATVGAEYVTEEESWCKITIDSAYVLTPQTITVKRPDGSVYRYGSTTASRIKSSTVPLPGAIGWMLTILNMFIRSQIMYLIFPKYDMVVIRKQEPLQSAQWSLLMSQDRILSNRLLKQEHTV
jgi:hypothetical protein